MSLAETFDPDDVRGFGVHPDAPPGPVTPLVSLRGVSKRFGDHVALENVDLDIQPGEILALLGPSGCGKTTLMRLLAGFESPDTGRILMQGCDLVGRPPERRQINMMFQSYALFPHLSVARNIAFGLQVRRRPRAEIEARVEDMLAMVKLEAFARRRPHELSGGQRQRVALARALACQPRLLLLDEPLGALDRRLREETQRELATIQRRSGTTFLLVTHDQDEAFSLADRVAVMREGRIAQIGAPQALYQTPADRHVAEFLGDINLVRAAIAEASPAGALLIADRCGPLLVRNPHGLPAGARALLAVRPEQLHLSRIGPAPGETNVLAATVRDVGFRGDRLTWQVEAAPGMTLRAVSHAPVAEAWSVGESVWVRIAADAALALPR
jgi:putrescine transport system ATP-binding protein